MREIKFRAWSGSEMLEPQDLSQDGFYWSWLGKEDVELMQYTGLKDKNGKEIYESDYLEGGGINVWCVFWGSGKYILQNISTGDIIDCNEIHTRNQEVAGNQYETPREHTAMASDI